MRQPIAVELVDEPSGLRPIAFFWQGRRLPIRSLGRRWQTGSELHFLVMTAAGKVYELAYDRPAAQWLLVRTPAEFGPPTPPQRPA